MADKIQPCPKCGSEKVDTYITCKTGDPWNDYYMVKCESCNLRGPVGWTPAEACRLWNEKAVEKQDG